MGMITDACNYSYVIVTDTTEILFTRILFRFFAIWNYSALFSRRASFLGGREK